jgi:hypothetical protein
MAKVMRTLATAPPPGWAPVLQASHGPNHATTLLRARRARAALRGSPPTTLIHLHAASDWSLRRKLSIARMAGPRPVVLHLHSGNTATWLAASTARAARIRSAIDAHVDVVVVLDDAWKARLEPWLGEVEVVQRRGFALDVLHHVRRERPEVHLHLTGGKRSTGAGWTRHGWLEDADRLRLLQSTDVLLLPSRFEGQPLAALEALACGVPVLASHALVGLPPTVARPDNDTLEAWSVAVCRLLDDRPSQETLVASVTPHAVEAITARWAEVYALAVERAARRGVSP